MKQGWEIKRLGEVSTFLNRGISPKYVDTKGVCVLNQKCIRDHVVSYEQSRRHDSLIKPVASQRFIKAGDVLVNSTGTGTLGRVAQVRNSPTEPTTVDSHVTIVRPKDGMFFSDFFGYMLIVIEEAIKEAGEGCGGQTELARSTLADKFHVHYPKSLSEQQRIAAILDEAFSSIAKAKANTEQNLKNARELFESYKNDLFLNKGKGYEERELLGICDKITQGPNPKYDKDGDDKFRVLKTKNLYDNHIFYYESDKVSESVFNSCLSSELKNGDVLLAIVGQGSINKCNVFENKTPFRYIYTRALGLMRVKKTVLDPYYLKAYLQSNKGKKLIDSGISGTSGQQVVTTTFIKAFKIPLPTLKTQLSIVHKLDALSAETKKLDTIYQQKLNDLEELKKSILQKAFSGELKTS